MSDDPQPAQRSWLDRIGQALLGEPKNRKQLISILRDAEQRDLIDPEALSMIEGVLNVSEMQVCEIMIPRNNMAVISKDMPYDEVMPLVIESAHSRFPVIGDSKDEVIGILLAKDLLLYQTPTHERFNIRDILRPAVFIPESKRLNILLNEFRKSRNHLAIVVDEYGSVTGLVTIEDVLEQIVGEIEDEHDIDEGLMIRQHTDHSYSVQALTPIGKFNDYFKSQLSDKDFDTVGGLVLQAFGHLPKRGDSIEIQGYLFTIQKANRRRIQVIGVTINDPIQEE